MIPVANSRTLEPLYQYIQVSIGQEEIVFLYQRNDQDGPYRNYLHNGDDKFETVHELADVFQVGSDLYRYRYGKWISI